MYVHGLYFQVEGDSRFRFQEEWDLMASPVGYMKWELYRHDKDTGAIVEKLESYSLGGVVHLAKTRGWIRPLEKSDDTRRYLVNTVEHSFETLRACNGDFTTYAIAKVEALQVGQDVQVYEYNVKRIS